MSWNLSLKINNLINKVNGIVAGTVVNPLNATLNAGGFNITNVGQLATTNLSAPNGTGSWGTKLTKTTNNSSIAWLSDRQLYTAYVSSENGVNEGFGSASAGSITSPFSTISYALLNLAAIVPAGAKCIIYIFPGSYLGFTLDTTAPTYNFNRLTNISFVGLTNTTGTSNVNLGASNTNTVKITTNSIINVENTIAIGSTINDYNISISNINFATTDLFIIQLTGKNHCFYMNNCNAVCTLTSVPAFPLIDINAIASFNINAYFNNCNISHNSSTNYSAGSDNSVLKCNRGIIKELNNCYLYATPVNSQALFITNAGSLEYVYNTTIISNSHPNALHINSTSQTNTTFNLCTMTANGNGTQPIVNLGHLNGTYTITNCTIKNSLITNPSTIYIGVGSNIILYSINNRFESEATTDQTFNPFGLSSTYAPAKTNNIIGYSNDTFINKLFTTSNTIAFPALSTNFTAINEINTYLPATPMSVVFYVDGTIGKDTYNGSQSYPFKTVQNALNKCVSNSLYYTIFVNAGTYAENLIITNPRLNLIGVQSNVNTKSVALQTITINTASISGPSLDIITIQNFVIGSAGVLSYPIMVNNIIANSGGYSLYITNCEITSSLTYSSIYLLANNLANTRYYISRCNILNINTGTPTEPLIFVGGGSIWSFDNNTVTNRASAAALGNETVPLLIGQNSGIINGISNCSFTSENQGMCIVTSSSNGNLPFSISNTFFSFKTVVQGSGASNLYSCITLAAKNTINLINCTLVNNAITSALSQQPYILLNTGSIVYARGNSFNMIYAPVNITQSQIYPVGNYGTNATQNAFVYSTNVYTNGSVSFSASPIYPSSGAVISRPFVIDSVGPTKTLLVYGNGTNAGGPQMYYKNAGLTAYTLNGNSGKDLGIFQNYASFGNSTLRAESTGTPVWGTTAATFPHLYFRETGIYLVNFNINVAGFGDLIYASINKNYLISTSTQAINDYPTVLVSNQTVSNAYTALVTCTVLITTAGTTAVPESGDYLVFGFYVTNSGNNITNAFRNQLSVYKIA